MRTMSASRIASRNSSGPSKSWTRILTLPSPWATWLSEPAPGTIRYLAANRSASSLNAVSATLGLKTSRMSISLDDRRAGARSRGPSAGGRTDGHVDEPALAADLGDRLGHGHPALDPLLEEEADHLPLLGRLHLLGDDHLDRRTRSAISRAAKRTRDLVVVGDRDRPEAALAGGREQRLDRRRAIGRVIGVHVQVDVDRTSAGDPAADARVAARIVAPGGDPRVDRLDLIGDRAPSRGPAPGPRAPALAQRRARQRAVRAGRRA